MEDQMNARDTAKTLKIAQNLIACDKDDLAIWLAWFILATKTFDDPHINSMIAIIKANIGNTKGI
jgi:hypothetical protein